MHIVALNVCVLKSSSLLAERPQRQCRRPINLEITRPRAPWERANLDAKFSDGVGEYARRFSDGQIFWVGRFSGCQIFWCQIFWGGVEIRPSTKNRQKSKNPKPPKFIKGSDQKMITENRPPPNRRKNARTDATAAACFWCK